MRNRSGSCFGSLQLFPVTNMQQLAGGDGNDGIMHVSNTIPENSAMHYCWPCIHVCSVPMRASREITKYEKH